MIYGSVCSGIEAASVAWHPLGWRASFLSEIEAFPRAVLAHHYPDTPLHGDFTTIAAGQYDPIDLLVGGTPCQSFSIAGLRGGLDDDRGNLALEYLRLAQRLRPRWLVWENVPGVFSSASHVAPDLCPPNIDLDAGDGPADGEEVVVEDHYDADESHAFSCILAGFSELGYGFAYRVLDAQFVGVAQRRRRVFVVGYLGDWRRAAAVLFERHSLSGNPAPRRETRKDLAPTISARPTGGGGLGADFDLDGGVIHCPDFVPQAMSSKWAKGSSGPSGPSGDEIANLVAVNAATAYRVAGDGAAYHEGDATAPLTTGTDSSASIVAFDTTQITSSANYSSPKAGDPCHPLAAGAHAPAVAFSIMPMNSGKDFKGRETDVAQPVMAAGPAGGNQGGDYIVHPINPNALRGDSQAKTPSMDAAGVMRLRDPGLGVGADGDPADTLQAAGPGAVAFALRGREGGAMPEIEGDGDRIGALRAASGGSSRDYVATSAVRRLTPRECERLQGFPDDYTLIPYRKGQAADGPRYKALGNSMAVPVMAWIGQRIATVDAIPLQQRVAA